MDLEADALPIEPPCPPRSGVSIHYNYKIKKNYGSKKNGQKQLQIKNIYKYIKANTVIVIQVPNGSMLHIPPTKVAIS